MAGRVANSVDPDQNAASYVGLHCLLSVLILRVTMIGIL